MLRFISRNIKQDMPMQHFTHEDFHRPNGQSVTCFQPHPMTILLIKQYARMCVTNKNLTNGYNGVPVAACS